MAVKSKKYNAAEKYFHGLLEKERADKKKLYHEIFNLSDKNSELLSENRNLKIRVAELEAEVSMIGKIQGLSKEEIEKAAKASDAVQGLLKVAKSLGGQCL